MYQHLTKLLLAGAVAAALLALGITSIPTPAWAAKPAKFPNYCLEGQVGKGYINPDGTAGWQCAPDDDALGALSCAAGQVAKEVLGKGWGCADDTDTDTQLNQAGVIALDFVTGPHTVDTTIPNTDALGALSCAAGQVAKTLSGEGWGCADDTDTDTQLNQAGVIALDFVTGPHTDDTDTLGDLTCETDQVARYNGSAWVCSETPDYGTGPKTVFVTSSKYNADLKTAGGALTGLRGADEICQAAAENGNVPPGTYIAWLSTSTKDAIDRLPDNAAGYILPNGDMVALSKADLINRNLLNNPIQYDEYGARYTDIAERVWTSTGANGRLFGGYKDPLWLGTCEDWTSTTQGTYAGVGVLVATAAAWTSGFERLCELSLRLYCFQR